ncbi:MAG: histone deacetylase [Planctomycetaceae bacterium]|nr:histone deacetylase [Planctomycetaceae bacterium]
MTLLYTSPHFLDHVTRPHPESPRRLSAIALRLKSQGWPERCTTPEWKRATHDELMAVHQRDYLLHIEAFCREGGGHADSDTVVCEESFDVALLAAGAVCDAVRRVTAGEDQTALCLVRPPGHHAMPHHAMGFCLLGNAAIAARLAVDALGLDRVMVIDWDVHHGNGTQAMCYDDPRIGFFSAHRWPFYPGSGDADETGRGDGLGATHNMPVRFGTSRRDYLTRFTNELEQFADRIKPQLVIISAGFDAHHQDPVGSLGLESEDFVAMTQAVRNVAATHAGGRIVSTLEGGYNIRVLAECVCLHLGELFTESSADSVGE